MRQLGKVSQMGKWRHTFRFSLLLKWVMTYAIQMPSVAREQHPEIGSPGFGLLLSCRILEHIPEIGWGWCLHTWVVLFAGLPLWLPAREAHFFLQGLGWLLPSLLLAAWNLEKDWVPLLLVKSWEGRRLSSLCFYTLRKRIDLSVSKLLVSLTLYYRSKVTFLKSPSKWSILCVSHSHAHTTHM